MIKMIAIFLAIFGLSFFGTQGFIAASGREKLDIARVFGRSLAHATLALVFVVTIVILF